MNNTAIAALESGAILWDDKVRGLHLRALPHRKSFYLFYRTKDGRQRRPKLGDLGLLTLTDARDMARDMLRHVAAGGDPQADRQQRREALTMRRLAARYLRYVRSDPKDKKKRRSIKEDLRQLKVYLLPCFGRRLAVDLTTAMVEAWHKDLADTPYQANRALALLSRMMNLAEAWNVRDKHTNPCRGVVRYQERRRKRYMRGEEAPKVAAALVKYEGQYPRAVLFIYLLILTGARPDEIARAEPSMIRGNALVLLEHKTDGHVDERVIFLPPRVLELINAVERTSGTITGILAPQKFWRKLRREVGCPDLRLYDLRRTFASAALRAGYNLDQIGELLGHTSGTTTKRYAWLMEEIRAEAATKTANVLEGMMARKALPAPDAASVENN